LNESALDEIIEVNNFSFEPTYKALRHNADNGNARPGLPICARKMLRDGVSQDQRVSCFRLAVHFRRMGLPFDMAVASLKTWALKNRPINGRRIIRDSEIVSQTMDAYKKPYAGYGCDSEAIKPFCEPTCPVKQEREQRKNFGEGKHKAGGI
jgi:hypothetical protein